MAQLRLFVLLLVAAVLVDPIVGDCYGQNPRFGNNRLKQGNNQARLFDSQNNAAGGYYWGPPLTYYAKSILSVEWTTQHACGNDNNDCQMVIQYLCSATDANATYRVRDGDGTTNGQITLNNFAEPSEVNPGEFMYGMHESVDYYLACTNRARNQGLYTAKENLGNTAMSTRQNAGGGASGLECGEERDYYPYWAPSPWKDIAVLTTNTEDCEFYKTQSQNVIEKNYCEGAKAGNGLQPSMQQECLAAGGKWLSAPAWNIPAPDCLAAPWGRDNHLGNGLDGQTQSYNWTLPGSAEEKALDNSTLVCVLRLRYNISSAETVGFGDNFTDSRYNGESSPVKDQATVMVSGRNLTLNTADDQFPRTFQDRTHTFFLAPRPDGISNDAKIWNLNVRGRRGNIVQTYPATEYDFTPNHLELIVGDYVHFQWTGALTNDDTAGNGDGTADRHNLVQIKSAKHNYPILDHEFEEFTPMFDDEETRAAFAHQNQENCRPYDEVMAQGTNDKQQDPQNCLQLNAASPYFNGGLIRMNNSGTFHYMDTRNNQYTNRSQKGALIVGPTPPLLTTAQTVGVAIAAVAVVGLAAAAGAVIYAKKNPHSSMANFVGKIPGLNRI